MKKLSYILLSLVVLLLFSSCAPSQTEPTDGTDSSSTSPGYTCGLPPSPVDREDPVDDLIQVKSSITVPAEYKLWDAGEWAVVPGQTFEWNRADEQSRLAWINGKGLSSDGLWKYLCYEHASEARSAGYKALPRQALSGGSYHYATSSSVDSVYTAKVSDFGEWFSAGAYVDVVKSFVCPSGGRVRLSSALEVLLSYKDGVVFSVYLENRQVYPTDGSRGISLFEAGQKRFDVEIDVKKNQRIFIHIGKAGSSEYSGIRMSNTVEYLSVNEEVATVSEFCTHEMDAWKVTAPATFRSDGSCTRACKFCPLLQYRVIPQIPREQCTSCDDFPYVLQFAPTIYYPGRESTTCGVCGRHRSRTIPCSETDVATGVTVYPFNGMMTHGTSLRVTTTEDGYDVPLIKGGVILSPYNGDLKVEMPCKAGTVPLKAYYISPDGTRSEISCSLVNDKLSVEIPDSGRIVLVYND